jgi:hypothetical protein
VSYLHWIERMYPVVAAILLPRLRPHRRGPRTRPHGIRRLARNDGRGDRLRSPTQTRILRPVVMSSRLLTHSRLLTAALVLAFAWAGPGGGTSHAQDLPSWAEPSDQTENDRSYRRDRETDRRNTGGRKRARSSSSDYNEDMLGPQMSTKGRFRTSNQGKCDPNDENPCGDGFTCVPAGESSNYVCRSNNSAKVPLSPVGALILAFSGLSYGVIGLKRRKWPDAST